MDIRPWGQPALFVFPLTVTGSQGVKTTPTLAAGDLKLVSDDQAGATLACKTRAFTSGGTARVFPGDSVVGATSAATAKIAAVLLTSGSWAGGDAAGTLFFYGDSGTFQSENLDKTGGQANICTIGGALSAAGVVVEWFTGWIACALSPTEMSCRVGAIVVRDAAGAEWEDTGVRFMTEMPPYDYSGFGTPTAADATTVTLPIGANSDDDSYLAVLMAESGLPTKLMFGAYVGSTRVFTFDPAPGITYTTAARVWPIPMPASPTTSKPTVLISSGTGTGQLDVTSGVIKSNLAQILGTALTETAGLLAGGFKKFFNIATPAATMDHGILVDEVTAANTTKIAGATIVGDGNATPWDGA